MTSTTVLIVGAGPTGLVLALWLNAQGVDVRIVDKNASTARQSRAMVVQARTLELYRQLDLADAVVQAGSTTARFNMWVRGTRRGQIAFDRAGRDITPFPFLLTYPQDQHETLLAARLEAVGVVVERETELLDFDDDGAAITARLHRPDGSVETCAADYIAGCDGGRSRVREHLGIGFGGGTYEHLFYVADVHATGAATDGEVHVAIDDADFVAVFPYGREGGMRLIGTVRDEREDAAETLAFGDVDHVAMERLGLTVTQVNWFSTYRVHHRVADRYRQGRAFVVGDAAHVHSPAGGQGMNTGIGDAINLAWKLAAVVRGDADESLLDTYGIERRAFAQRLVDTTDRMFTAAVSDSRLAQCIRTRIAPALASTATRFSPLREFLFRTASQTRIHYRHSPLSSGQAGRLRGGDRLPWVPEDRTDNHAPLASIAWQVHVYGSAPPSLAQWAGGQGIALHAFEWTKRHGNAGLARDAAYLIRPDTHIAVANPSAEADVFDAYVRKVAIRLA